MADFLALWVVFLDHRFLVIGVLGLGEDEVGGGVIACLSEALDVAIGDLGCTAIVGACDAVGLEDSLKVGRGVSPLVVFSFQEGVEGRLLLRERDEGFIHVGCEVGDEGGGKMEDLLETSASRPRCGEDGGDEGVEGGPLQCDVLVSGEGGVCFVEAAGL